jgi:hypothetical protein
MQYLPPALREANAPGHPVYPVAPADGTGVGPVKYVFLTRTGRAGGLFFKRIPLEFSSAPIVHYHSLDISAPLFNRLSLKTISVTFIKFRVKLFCTIRTEPVAELSVGMFTYICLNSVPIPFVITDVLAI